MTNTEKNNYVFRIHISMHVKLFLHIGFTQFHWRVVTYNLDELLLGTIVGTGKGISIMKLYGI